MRRTLALVACAVLCVSTAARADDKQECVAASEKGQELRDQGNYSDARDAFATCARPVCPALVRHDCTGWLADLEQQWPSVVVEAKDVKGSDLVDVQVLLDGVTIAKQLDGKPIRVDPGQHLFRFVSGSYPPVEQSVLVSAGEHDRVLHVDFRMPGEPAPPPPGGAGTGPGSQATAGGGPPVWAWVFAGVGVAAFGTEAYLGFTGLDMLHSDQAKPNGCAPSCSGDQVQAIRLRFLGADIAMGVGIASALASAYFFVLAPRDRAQPAKTGLRFDFRPVPGGGAAIVGGRF